MVLGFRDLGFRGLGLRVFGCRGLGFGVEGFVLLEEATEKKGDYRGAEGR